MLRLARSNHDWSSLGRIILNSSQFISVKHPAMGATIHIGHWLKDMMKAVGIDTNAFSVHSIRNTSTFWSAHIKGFKGDELEFLLHLLPILK